MIDDNILKAKVLRILYIKSSRRYSSCEPRQLFSHGNKSRFTEHVDQNCGFLSIITSIHTCDIDKVCLIITNKETTMKVRKKCVKSYNINAKCS